jgi:hypothetical protein
MVSGRRIAGIKGPASCTVSRFPDKWVFVVVVCGNSAVIEEVVLHQSYQDSSEPVVLVY